MGFLLHLLEIAILKGILVAMEKTDGLWFMREDGLRLTGESANFVGFAVLRHLIIDPCQ